VGAAILDGSGQVLRMTPMAEALLAERDGLRLIGQRPHALSTAEDRILQRMIRGALRGSAIAAGEPEAISISRPSGARALGLVIQSVGGPDRLSQRSAPAAALFFRDPERNVEVANNVIRELFDLTPAEAELARRLAEGLSLADAAHVLNIRRNTARAHLRAIFSKSGITRQSELVRVLLNSAAVLGSGAEAVPHADLRVKAA
jgi:DNA-binding CsgD family transcriptional regulator